MPGLDAPSDGGSWSPVRQSANGPKAPSVEEQKEIALRLHRESGLDLSQGDEFCLLSFSWWRKWKSFIGEQDEDENEVRVSSHDEDAAMQDGPPGPIDNAPLVEPINNAAGTSTSFSIFSGAEGSTWRLRRALVEEQDYVLVSVQLWRALHSWYGGGPEITRLVVPMGKMGSSFAVEVYPLTLKLILSSAPEEPRTIVLSKKAKVLDLELKVCEIFSKTEAEFRLWDNYNGKRQNLLKDLGQTLEEAALAMDNEILIEERAPDGTFPEMDDSLPHMANGSHLSPSATAQQALVPGVGALGQESVISIAGGPLSQYAGVDASSAMDSDEGEERTESKSRVALETPSLGASSLALVPSSSQAGDEASTSSGFGMTLRSQFAAQQGGRLCGLAGLVNLGNTCFMNSAIQCLVHTPPLVDFFCKTDYTQEINSTNPLGMEGEIALSFGELTKKLWSPGNEPVAPRAFKARLSRFAPQFSGYNQHDSQELLAFLLDGLHEDLNRVVKKPYIEAKDSEGRPDMEVAAEYWANHLKRNNSFIIHTCQGQFRSTLVCPVCSKVSKTFDPFTHLSLPLPSKTMRPITVTVVAADGSVLPCTATVNVPRSGLVEDLTRQLALQLSLADNERLVLAEIYQNKVHRVYSPMQALSIIAEQDRVVAYRVPSGCPNPVFVNQRTRTRPGARLTGAKPSLYPNWVPTGTPFVLPQSRVLVETGEQVYKLVKAALHPFRTKKPPPPDSDLPSPSPRSEADRKGKGPAGTDAMEEDDATTPGAQSEEGSREDSPDMDATSGGDDLSAPSDAGTDKQPDWVSESSSSSVAREGVEETKAGKKARFSNGFRLKFWTSTGDKEWVEIPDTSDPLPQNFYIAGTLSGDHQPMSLDWVPRAFGEMYDMKQLDDLPIVGGSQPSFWSFGLSNFRQAIPGMNKGKEGISLYTCLDAFLTEEPLGPDDMWYCPKCKEFRQATKKMDLWKLPDILVIHLKRFSYSRYYKNKIDSIVDFPVRNLDLTPYVQGRRAAQSKHTSTGNGAPAEKKSPEGVEPAGEAPGETPGEEGGVDQGPANGGAAEGEEGGGEKFLYDLYAVSNHFGGMGGGHYTAYAKHPDDGNWYCFDDSYVSSTTESHVKSPAAYVLFYQRVKDTKTQ